MLGNAAGLTLCHVGVPDRIEELRLPVIDVTHDRHHGWSRDGTRLLGTGSDNLGQAPFLVDYFRSALDEFDSEVGGDFGRGLEIDLLIDVGHHAPAYQGLDELDGTDADGLGQLAYRHDASDLDRAAGDTRSRRAPLCSHRRPIVLYRCVLFRFGAHS